MTIASNLVHRARLALLALFALPSSVAMADPSGSATSVADGGWDIVSQYGPIWGGALLIQGIVGSFLRRNAATHWLAQGRTLAAITASSMVLGSVLNWHIGGAPLSGVVVTAIMAIKLLWSPTIKPTLATVIDSVFRRSDEPVGRSVATPSAVELEVAGYTIGPVMPAPSETP